MSNTLLCIELGTSKALITKHFKVIQIMLMLGNNYIFVQMCRIVFKDKCHLSYIVMRVINKCHVYKGYFNTMFLKRLMVTYSYQNKLNVPLSFF